MPRELAASERPGCSGKRERRSRYPLRRRGGARAAAPRDLWIGVFPGRNVHETQEAAPQRDRYPLPREVAGDVLCRGLPWGRGFQSRPQRFRGRRLGHQGTPSRPAGADERKSYFAEAKSVSQIEARQLLNRVRRAMGRWQGIKEMGPYRWNLCLLYLLLSPHPL